jgi:hypothetical protein
MWRPGSITHRGLIGASAVGGRSLTGAMRLTGHYVSARGCVVE